MMVPTGPRHRASRMAQVLISVFGNNAAEDAGGSIGPIGTCQGEGRGFGSRRPLQKRQVREGLRPSLFCVWSRIGAWRLGLVALLTDL